MWQTILSKGGLWELFIRGGPVMWPILICSVVALAVVMDRVYHLHKAKIDTDRFLETISASLRRNRVVEAIDLCGQTPGPIAHILKAGIMKHDRTREEVRDAIEEAGVQEVSRLERYLAVLATVSQIAPLLGLLGTVTGMVTAFQIIQEKATAMSQVNPGDLAGGIWEALLTTVFGLCVAIPTLIAYNWLTHWVNYFVLDMERSSAELVNVLGQRREADAVEIPD